MAGAGDHHFLLTVVNIVVGILPISCSVHNLIYQALLITLVFIACQGERLYDSRICSSIKSHQHHGDVRRHVSYEEDALICVEGGCTLAIHQVGPIISTR